MLKNQTRNTPKAVSNQPFPDLEFSQAPVSQKQIFVVGLVLVLATIAAYGPTLRNDFIYF